MFGGYAGTELNDTWSGDGKAWTRHIAAGAPPIRHSHGMAFVAVNQRTVLAPGTGFNRRVLRGFGLLR